MTLEKAIKNFTAARHDCGMIPPEEYTPTIKLGLEALKRERRWRLSARCTSYDLLPGETKE